MNKRYIYIIIAIIFCLMKLLSAKSFENQSILDVMIFFTFGSFEINSAAIMEIAMNMIPFVVYQMVNGLYVHRKLGTAGVYCFYRSEKRGYFVLRELTGLFIETVLFAILYYLVPFVFSVLIWKPSFEAKMIIPMLWGIMVIILWLYISCVLINLTALLVSSVFGFSLIAGFQFLCISLLMLCAPGMPFDLQIEKKRETGLVFLRANPFSRLILSWYHYENDGSLLLSDYFGVELSFVTSIVIMIVVLMVSIFALYRVVKKMEIYGDLSE